MFFSFLKNKLGVFLLSLLFLFSLTKNCYAGSWGETASAFIANRVYLEVQEQLKAVILAQAQELATKTLNDIAMNSLSTSDAVRFIGDYGEFLFDSQKEKGLEIINDYFDVVGEGNSQLSDNYAMVEEATKNYLSELTGDVDSMAKSSFSNLFPEDNNPFGTVSGASPSTTLGIAIGGDPDTSFVEAVSHLNKELDKNLKADMANITANGPAPTYENENGDIKGGALAASLIEELRAYPLAVAASTPLEAPGVIPLLTSAIRGVISDNIPFYKGKDSAYSDPTKNIERYIDGFGGELSTVADSLWSDPDIQDKSFDDFLNDL